MKKILLFALGLMTLVGCRHDFDIDNSEFVKNNAEQRLGMIDPNQDWNCITTGTVSVTADASLQNIVKVQILTESPFMNDQAKILAEASASKGDVVTLNYDAPNAYTRLIAACVDDKGNYFIKGFNMTESKVSFQSATTRGFGFTRAANDLPDISQIQVKFSDSFLSFNAGRALSEDATFSNWKDKNWENDRLWRPSGLTASGSWTMDRYTIFRDATPFTEEDKATLQDIFNASLYRDDPKGVRGKRDNLSLIREGSAVKFFSNHLVSNGKAAITLSPIQMASTEAHMCDIYYYYYKAANVPAGTSETDYIKSLPKYKAIDLGLEREKFQEQTGIEKNKRDENFLRLHEYILPYYGEPSEFEPFAQMLSHLGYKADTNFYRIHNASEGKNNYFTYADPSENLKDAYSVDVEKQLWQVFTNDSDPDNVKVMLYNVYAKQFLYYVGKEKNGVVLKDIDSKNLDKFNFRICDPNAKQTDSRTDIYIFENGMSNCLKSVSGVWIGNGGKSNTGNFLLTRLWSFEKYEDSSATPITDFELPVKYFPNIYPAKSDNASAIIPDGYRIGFMIRKDNGTTTYNDGALKNDKYGCMYGCGDLNKEINTFGQFKTATTDYSMNNDDPRMATFTANGKTYLCFEEGADTQYSDVILEIGGVSSTQVMKALAVETDNANPQTVMSLSNGQVESGIYMYEDMIEDRTQHQAYTMCFEDRPLTADYDLNDVVLRCSRVDATTLSLALVACGADDDVIIHGAEGWELNDQEAHQIFRATTPDAQGHRYVNTKTGGTHREVQARYVDVDPSMTIPEYLKKIYIENVTQGGNTISIATKGVPPCAIIVPEDFQYPQESVSITVAYKDFITWAQNYTQCKSWYQWGDDSKYYDLSELIGNGVIKKW